MVYEPVALDSVTWETNRKGCLLYTSVLGDGAIDFEKIGAEVPNEMQRDPKTNGGETTLYTRDRACYAPYGISYTKKRQSTLSPTNEELANGENWTLVHNGGSGAGRCV